MFWIPYNQSNRFNTCSLNFLSRQTNGRYNWQWSSSTLEKHCFYAPWVSYIQFKNVHIQKTIFWRLATGILSLLAAYEAPIELNLEHTARVFNCTHIIKMWPSQPFGQIAIYQAQQALNAPCLRKIESPLVTSCEWIRVLQQRSIVPIIKPSGSVTCILTQAYSLGSQAMVKRW